MSEPAAYPPPPPPLSEWPAAPPAVAGDLASWGRRFASQLLDLLIAAAIVIPAFVAAALAAELATDTDDLDQLADIVWIPVWGLWLLLYYPLTMRRAGAHNGQTWGRQIVKLRVVREDGYAVDAKNAILREVIMKQIVFWSFSGCLLFIPAILDALWPLWDERRQSLHDKAVSTLVVRA